MYNKEEADELLDHILKNLATFSAEDDLNPEYITKARCYTTKGPISFDLHHLWSPHGVHRYVDLIATGYFTNISLFRKNHHIVQFGAVKHPQTGERKKFSGMKSIPDDPKTDCFGKCRSGYLWEGAVSYAGGGKNSRSAQSFFVFRSELWETPIGNITEGFNIVKDKIYGGYGEKVDQRKIFQEGNDYIKREFPLIDYIERCELVEEDSFVKRLSDVSAEVMKAREGNETLFMVVLFSIMILTLLFGRRIILLSLNRKKQS
eukprot:snap_masked-scaffold_21-processed-gene-1.9-mRNA-1 protein AED:0.18 eAED:0.19 QI:0/0/0/1/1/1/2/0/260